MKNSINIKTHKIGKNLKPFIIAEMSGNHNQSFEKAIEIVEAAAKVGASALKLQTYTADTLTINKRDGEFFLKDKNSLWYGMSMYELYQKAHTPWEWHEPIFKKCEQLGLVCFSSVFDETSVDFLEGLNCPCYKIGSTENTDLKLLQKVAKTGKPIIISTGMATVSELGDIVSTVREAGCSELILLKCTATYPTDPSESNLLTIPHLSELFNCYVGLSDHTLGTAVPIASIALGAVVIEKHLTISRKDLGVDSKFSLEPREFSKLVIDSEIAWKSRGAIYYGPTNTENSRLARRSLYVVKDMKEGDVFNKENVKSIRPGYGLPVKYYDHVMGMKASRDIPWGTRLSFALVK